MLAKTPKSAKQNLSFPEFAKSHGLKCEFSCEDATRTPLERLKTFYKAAEDANADVVNIPDTLGVMEPDAMFSLVTEIRKTVKIPISVHCHNDFGLAVMNSLAGVKAGASQVHVTVYADCSERARTVVLQDYRLCGGAFARSWEIGRMARARQKDAGKLDWEKRGNSSLFQTQGHKRNCACLYHKT